MKVETLGKKTISTLELPFLTIINKKYVAELSSWIDRKSATYSLANIPYEFRGIAGTDEIVGGSILWLGIIKLVIFIFSLKNGNIQNLILSRVVDNGVSDFTKDKGCWCNNIYSDIYYEKPIRTTRGLFSIVYYEVTKIIKKQISNCTIR
ncbi:hypothetical protein Glove_29g33 [Diversispora epigaea]|uniref:Uncharacterized protein n=1 Tax=Diversispora epigaea TaxID=1348612 RepID=A0A397JIN3_9GLOM|nr:hypothetical protein Glove_29g33 [Diversispora epigaea]